MFSKLQKVFQNGINTGGISPSPKVFSKDILQTHKNNVVWEEAK